MQAWMPEARPAQPLALDPDPALAELLDAIRHGGQEAYGRLLEVLRELKSLEAGTAIYKQALAELARAQGVVLGNVGLFVDASVDPETLTHSKAALATALVRQGLADASRGGGDGLPLLRGITAQTLAGVAAEEQAIAFGERVWCLRQLARTLRDRHGVEAHVADGSITTGEFEMLKRRFVADEFPVLCLSRIGHEGHNLQNASVLCHLDLPWLPTGLEQRVGRAARRGAARARVQTHIPYIRCGGIEHVVSVLAARGAEHHQILDSFEGVHATESTVATQLSEITGSGSRASPGDRPGAPLPRVRGPLDQADGRPSGPFAGDRQGLLLRPHRREARAVKARYVGVCRAAAALTRNRATARATPTRTARPATPARSSGAGRVSACLRRSACGARDTGDCRPRMTGRARTRVGAGERRSKRLGDCEWPSAAVVSDLFGGWPAARAAASRPD
jgi:Helicase conserved C-terminal domain